MALMFQRLARNYIRNGYFPTDGETIRRVLNALNAAESGELRILDPCCGEGVALAECKHHLGADRTAAFGVEYDEERAWAAKEILDQTIHGDLMDCIVGKRQFGLLWLNPPYGDLVADRMDNAGINWKGRKRLEKLFYERTNAMLQFGGVLVLIIPHYSLDRELAGWIARHFTGVRAFLAPEQQFKQVVVLGVRRRVSEAADVSSVREALAAVGEGYLPPDLPEDWLYGFYTVPAVPDGEATFVQTRLDARQLQEVISQHRCLWERFDGLFGSTGLAPRRPLRALSPWHLGLTLAAGQVSGVVTAKDGRVYVIKGDTHKEKKIDIEHEIDHKGDVRETRIHTDRFVPVIRALDFTPDSPTFGRALQIR